MDSFCSSLSGCLVGAYAVGCLASFVLFLMARVTKLNAHPPWLNLDRRLKTKWWTGRQGVYSRHWNLITLTTLVALFSSWLGFIYLGIQVVTPYRPNSLLRDLEVQILYYAHLIVAVLLTSAAVFIFLDIVFGVRERFF